MASLVVMADPVKTANPDLAQMVARAGPVAKVEPVALVAVGAMEDVGVTVEFPSSSRSRSGRSQSAPLVRVAIHQDLQASGETVPVAKVLR